MPGITPLIRTARSRARPATGLLTQASTRYLCARASRPGTPGLIAPGPGFRIPRLRPEHYAFANRTCSVKAADFASNLLRAGVAHPGDWAATRRVAPFLQQTLRRFVEERSSSIDRAFSLQLDLSPTCGVGWTKEHADLRRILLSFRVIDHVTWVNLTPALELLNKEHRLLPSVLYHSLTSAVSRWFRVFDIEEARCRWENWVSMREEEEEYSRADSEQSGALYEEGVKREEPRLPDCIQPTMPILPQSAVSLARSRKTKQLMAAVEDLARIAQLPYPPLTQPFSEEDRQEIFPDADPDVPMLTLAFGEHDTVTEFLNDEIEVAGQVELEPWPIFKMDATNPVSIREAFTCAALALDTLAAAARVLTLIHGFEPFS